MTSRWKKKKYPEFVRRVLWKKRSILHPYSIRGDVKEILELSNSAVKCSDIWKESFSALVKDDKRYIELANAFFTLELYLAKAAVATDSDDRSPILLCVIKNDLLRLQLFLSHYRELGVRHFAFIDDSSTDGTRELLAAQPDVDLFVSDVSYTTTVRQAWMSRLIDYYGFNRWYLIVDSDELLVYDQCETCGINSLVSGLESASVQAGRCFLLDMYGKDSLFGSTDTSELEWVDDLSYFDNSGYEIVDRVHSFGIAGGMRKRIFGNRPTLTKHPLAYAVPGFVPCHSHYSYPFYLNDKSAFIGALKHYKFLPSDKERYAERAKSGKFAEGSAEYKTYMELNESGEIITYKEGLSCKYVDSGSLSELVLPLGFTDDAVHCVPAVVS